MTRLIISFISLFLLLFSAIPAGYAQTGHTAAKQAIMIDYDTSMVLFEKGADQRMPTSSMSKVMTMYMVFNALKESRITLDGTLPVSEKAWKKGGSKMFIEVGNRVKIEDLIRGVIVQSGNDATIALAEGLSGSEETFATTMTDTARRIGMANSQFKNASGWPDPDHYSTARDLATLGQKLIRDFPDYYHYFSETEFTYNNIKQRNRNPLLYRNIGADGIKTGHTDSGGYGLMASGKKGDRRVIMVVNGLKDEKARAQESARLLEWGLNGFQNVNLFKAGDTVNQAYITMGTKEQVSLTIAEDLNITIPISVKNDLKVEAIYNSPLSAPLTKGTPVGKLRVEIPRMHTFEVPLLVAEDVSELGLIAGAVAKAKLLVFGVESTKKMSLFITIEGGEGTGKTTQIKLLADQLQKKGHEVLTTREPGGTPEAEKIRNLLVHREGGNWTRRPNACSFSPPARCMSKH